MLPEHEHVPEVKSMLGPRPSRKGPGPRYRATCSCGWVGPWRRSRTDADEDASAHHLAEWPDDREGSAYR